MCAWVSKQVVEYSYGGVYGASNRTNYEQNTYTRKTDSLGGVGAEKWWLTTENGQSRGVFSIFASRLFILQAGSHLQRNEIRLAKMKKTNPRVRYSHIVYTLPPAADVHEPAHRQSGPGPSLLARRWHQRRAAATELHTLPRTNFRRLP